MSKNRREYIEGHLARVSQERSHGATLDDVPELLPAFKSPDEEVRAAALRRSCPCHVSWDVYEHLRKPALKLRRDPSPQVRALANHLEEDARELWEMEASVERYADQDDERVWQPKPSSKRSKRQSQRPR
jgi:hypothetical protein